MKVPGNMRMLSIGFIEKSSPGDVIASRIVTNVRPGYHVNEQNGSCFREICLLALGGQENNLKQHESISEGRNT